MKFHRSRIFRIKSVYEKHCSMCHKWLPAGKFSIAAGRKGGLQSTCRSCKSELDRSYTSRMSRYNRSIREPVERVLMYQEQPGMDLEAIKEIDLSRLKRKSHGSGIRRK